MRVCNGTLLPNSREGCGTGETADISVTASADSTVVGIGDPVAYTVTVTNSHISSVPYTSGVLLTLESEGGIAIGSYAPTQGICYLETHRCDLGIIENGESASVVVAGTAVALGRTTTIIFVTRSEPDPT